MAAEIADLWWVMFWLGLLAFVIFAYVLVRGLARSSNEEAARTDPAGERSGRNLIIGGGVVLPVVLISVVFALTIQAMRSMPSASGDDPLIIEITGHQWWWEIYYPELGVRTANEFHIPIGREIEFRLTSADVIHSFWLPSLGGKLDLLPDRVNTLHLRADEPGNYGGICAEFCGLQHANMRINAIAESTDRYEAWVTGQQAAAVEPSDEQSVKGLDVFLGAGCTDCHSIRGTAAGGDSGPDLTHLATRSTIGAGVLPNTPEHLARWVDDPQSEKEGIDMESAELSAGDLADLIAYLGSLE